MKKFHPPLGNKVYWITQTYHGVNINNPQDLSYHCAMDISAVGKDPLFAVDSGVAIWTGLADPARPQFGWSFALDIGQSFNVYYVHTANPTVKVGQKVIRGQQIGVVHTMNASHLHFALRNKSGKAPHPGPMSYMPRSLSYNTRYKEIADVWFKNGIINWSLFPDLSLEDGNTVFPKRGQRIEWLKDVNIKPAQNTDCSKDSRCKVAKAGSVGEVLSDEVRTDNRFQYMDIRMLNAQGWSRVGYNQVNHDYFKVTTKPVTPIDPTPPPPPPPPPPEPTCEEKLRAANAKLDQTQKLLTTAIENNKDLQETNTSLEEEVEDLSNQLLEMSEGLKECADRITKLESDIKIRDNEILEQDKLINEWQQKYYSEFEDHAITKEALEACEGSSQPSGCLPFNKFFKKPDDTLPE